MTLILEDGTGVSDANAWTDVDGMDAYAATNNLTDWLDGEGDPEASIIRATAVLSNAYSWKGIRTYGRLQGTAFPRIQLTDGEGNQISVSEIPIEIINASCELAAYERANPGGLTPSFIQSGQIKRETIGPITFEYANLITNFEQTTPVLSAVENLITGFLSVAGRSNGNFAYGYRV